MKRFSILFLGIALGMMFVSGIWFYVEPISSSHDAPAQTGFNSADWLTGDARTRAAMYKDLVQLLEKDRPTKHEIEELLGKPAQEITSFSPADTYLVYLLDNGQRLARKPFLDKLGIGVNSDGTYSHVITWD